MASEAQAAVVVPQNVEKLPLFHWRPGHRLLSVGSRDGAIFDGPAKDEAQSFQRRINAEFLTRSQQQLGTGGWVANWSEPLANPAGLALLAGLPGPLVIASAGRGDLHQVGGLCDRADAWLLLLSADAGPAAAEILESGRHVEVLLGLDESGSLPDLPMERAVAIHLVPRRPALAVGALLDDLCDHAIDALPGGTAIYDHRRQHSVCESCGETLIWRSGGRSRPDALDSNTGACANCGTPVAGVW